MRLPMVSERFFSAFTPLGYVLDRPVIVSAKELPPVLGILISFSQPILTRSPDRKLLELSDDTSVLDWPAKTTAHGEAAWPES